MRALTCLCTTLAALAFIAAAPAAYAADATDSMTVTATVLDSCSVSATDLDFGDYDPLAATPLDMATELTVTCTNGTDYDVALDAGLGAGATVAARKMSDGANTLTYALYSDGARNDVWGETESVNTVAGSGSGVAQSIDVFGRVPINQTSPAGDYEDTIIVTVIY